MDPLGAVAEAVAEPVVQIGAAPVAIPEVPAVPVKPAVKQQQRDAAVTEESRVLSPAERPSAFRSGARPGVTAGRQVILLTGQGASSSLAEPGPTRRSGGRGQHLNPW